MITDEELRSYLDGSQGTTGLDMARELVLLRKEHHMLHSQFVEVVERCKTLQDTAESHMHRASESETRLRSIMDSLSNIVGVKDAKQE